MKAIVLLQFRNLDNELIYTRAFHLKLRNWKIIIQLMKYVY